MKRHMLDFQLSEMAVADALAWASAEAVAPRVGWAGGLEKMASFLDAIHNPSPCITVHSGAAAARAAAQPDSSNCASQA